MRYTEFAAGDYDHWAVDDYGDSGDNLFSSGTPLVSHLAGTNFTSAISEFSVTVPSGYNGIYVSWHEYPPNYSDMSGRFVIGTGPRGSCSGARAKIEVTIKLKSGWIVSFPVDRSNSQIALLSCPTGSDIDIDYSSPVDYQNGYYYIFQGVSTGIVNGVVTITNESGSTITIKYIVGRPDSPSSPSCTDADNSFKILRGNITPPNLMLYGNGQAPQPQPVAKNVTYHYYRGGSYVSTVLQQNTVSYPTDADNQFTVNSTTFTKTDWTVAEGTTVSADMDVYAIYNASRLFADTFINIYGWYPYGGSETYRKLMLTLTESFSKADIRADSVSDTTTSFRKVTINSLGRSSSSPTSTWNVNYTVDTASGYTVSLTPTSGINGNYHFATFYDNSKTYHELTDWTVTFPYEITSTGTKNIYSHWSNKTIRRYRNSGRFSGVENASQGAGWYRDVDPQKYDNGVWRDTNLYKYVYNIGWVNQDTDLLLNR